MYCPHCRKTQKGFDYLFVQKYQICYPCMCKEAKGVDERIPIEMANEILKKFSGMRVKFE